jgi:hypothetical protein
MNTLTGAVGELLEEFSESFVEPGVSELVAGEFTINSCVCLGGRGVIKPQ